MKPYVKSLVSDFNLDNHKLIQTVSSVHAMPLVPKLFSIDKYIFLRETQYKMVSFGTNFIFG